MGQIKKQRIGLLLVTGPGSRDIETPRLQTQKLPISGISLNHGRACCSILCTVLVRKTDRQQSAIAQVRFHNPVKGLAAVFHIILKALAIGRGRNQTATHRTAFVQGRADVSIHPIVIPTTCGCPNTGLKLIRGTLAYHVHRATISTIPGHQTGRTFQDLDTINLGHIVHGVLGLRIDQPATGLLTHPIGLHVHRRAANREVERITLLVYRYTRRLLQHVRQFVQIEVIQTLACHDSDGLRRLAQRQIKPCRRATRPSSRIRTRTFRDRTGSAHLDGCQLLHIHLLAQMDRIASTGVSNARALQQLVQSRFRCHATRHGRSLDTAHQVGGVNKLERGLLA